MKNNAILLGMLTLMGVTTFVQSTQQPIKNNDKALTYNWIVTIFTLT